MSGWIWKIPHLLEFMQLCVSYASFVTELAAGGVWAILLQWGCVRLLQVRTWLLPTAAAIMHSNNTAAFTLPCLHIFGIKL